MELFNSLSRQKESIENELDLTLTWQDLPNKKASTITIAENKPRIKMTETWDDCFKWYADIVKRFKDISPKYF